MQNERLQRLKRLMDLAGVDQRELARNIGRLEPAVSRYFREHREAPDEFYEESEAFLDRRLKELIRNLLREMGAIAS